MRELKFRAWDRVKRKMLYGVSPFNIDIKDENEPLLSMEYSNHDDCEFEQYTGLKDKNGKEIYEGDIVRITDDQITTIMGKTTRSRVTEKAQVYWDDDGLSWCYKDIDENETEMARLKGGSDSWRIWELECEVIGNIHENAELLGEEEEWKKH
jgi:uncharacterized phage protein (TIGR01671 family)